MGLFSRKTEESDITLIQVQEKESVVQVIRQRFYGRTFKGKEREESPSLKVISVPKLTKSATIASPRIPSSPLAKNQFPPKSPQPRPVRAKTPLPRPHRPPPVPAPPTPSTSTPSTSSSIPPLPTPAPRNPTDAVTVNLAQRLNELAAAHVDGILSDDDYRLLRQDLFERFSGSGSTDVPTEPSIVPARPRKTLPGSSIDGSRGSTSSRPSSNFTVEVPRTSSSRNSLTSGVSSIFRSNSSRRNGSKDLSETGSMMSQSSKISSVTNRISRALSRKHSNSSLKTNRSLQVDTLSIASKNRLSVNVDRTLLEQRSLNSMGSKSNSSMRKYAAGAPPSSFPGKFPVASSLNKDPYSDEENLKSSVDIRKEMATVEAECRRLMDAFNGLELTVLTKRNRGPPSQSIAGSDFGSEMDSASVIYPRSIYGRRDNSDVVSVRSTTSAGTSRSNARSIHSQAPNKRVLNRAKTNTSLSSTAALHSLLPVSSSSAMPSPSAAIPRSTSSRSGSLVRKTSQSSVKSSQSRGVPKLPTVPYNTSLNIVPPPNSPLPIGPGSRNESTSSLTLSQAGGPNRSAGHLPLPTPASVYSRTTNWDNAETLSSRGRSGSVRSHNRPPNVAVTGFSDEDTIVEGTAFHDDLDDIKRRREEVSAQYDARLDYLRAKLKSAMLHEKLLKR